MRTKALILAAAIAAGSAITGAAQTVYSINAVGYVNLVMPAGFSMIANPLNTTNNTLEALIPTPPDFTTIYKWNGTGYDISTYFFGWSDPALTLNPGEGCFINATAEFTNTFVGEVVQNPPTGGTVTNSLPAGYSIVSSMVPQAGTATELGLTGAMGDFDTVYQYDPAKNGGAGGYDIYTYFLGWSDEPSFAVGESFWVNKATAGDWLRDFTVNTP
jgi:hypothetical protein